ncbi:DUF2179 domain-containing protein [Flavobacterium sp. UBA6135]
MRRLKNEIKNIDPKALVVTNTVEEN